MHLMPIDRRQRKMGLCKLGWPTVRSRPAKATQRNTVSKPSKTNKMSEIEKLKNRKKQKDKFRTRRD